MRQFTNMLLLSGVLIFVGYLFLSDGAKNSGTGNVAPQTPPPAQVSTTNNAAKKEPVEKPAEEKTEVARQFSAWPFLQDSDDKLDLAESMTQKNYVLVFDGSGSMKKSGCSGHLTKIEAAKKAVIEWSGSVADDANLGLIVFDRSGFSVRLELGVNNRDQFRKEVENVVADYKTPLTRSLNTAYQMLTVQARKQLGYGEYTVVTVTDGVANDMVTLHGAVNNILIQSPIMIHTIGFCLRGGHTLNNEGRTEYRAANNPEELKRGLQEVLAESEDFDIQGFE